MSLRYNVMRRAAVAALYLGMTLACGAAEIQVPFYTIQDVPRLKAFKGRDCTYCNVGSNTGFYGFDWEGVNGAKAFTAEVMRRAAVR